MLEYKDYIMLDMTQEHQHLPRPHMAPSMVEVQISRVTHYKKIEMKYYETITKEHLCSTIMLLEKSMDSRIS